MPNDIFKSHNFKFKQKMFIKIFILIKIFTKIFFIHFKDKFFREKHTQKSKKFFFLSYFFLTENM